MNWSPRAKERIASRLDLIRGWSVLNASYEAAPDVDDGTWFVDPPYAGRAGSFYRRRFTGHDALGDWCRSRRGLTIVTEGPEATWLPFEALGSFKSTKGRADEVVWLAGL